MWLIGLALFAFDAPPVPDQKVEGANAVRCRAAAEFIGDVVLPTARTGKRRIVFDQHGSVQGRQRLEQHFQLNPPAPPARLLSRLEGNLHLNAVRFCAEVRILLNQRRVRFDARSVEAGRRLKRNLGSRAVIYMASLPVLSEDGRQALFGQAVFCGGRCGLGALVHVRRDPHGKWVRVNEHGLWIS
jgi:hypothetical protein